MPSVVHVVTTANFAGVERYVCEVARETVDRGWGSRSSGDTRSTMPSELGDAATWLPGATQLPRRLRSMRRLGRRDVCHAHMTVAEAVAVAARPVHRAPVVATRHFAARRGTSRGGRILAPWIARGLQREIAVSEFVASRLERRPDAVLLNGVPPSPLPLESSNTDRARLQRLEPEKDTLTALTRVARVRSWSRRAGGCASSATALSELLSRRGPSPKASPR